MLLLIRNAVVTADLRSIQAGRQTMRKHVAAFERDGKGEGGEKISFNAFVYAVFLAVVLGCGDVIWGLVHDNAALDRRVSVLEVKCLPGPSRGVAAK
jgi:hypothetical protein